VPFRPKNDSELERLDEDSLFAYMVEARDAGETVEARRAAGRLCFGRERQIRARIRMDVDIEADVDDLTATVLEQAIRARFQGDHPGQFFSLVKTIRKRRVADYLESQNERKRLQESLTSAEGEDRDVPVNGERVDLLLALEECLATESERNRMIVELRIDGYRAREVAEQVRESGIDGDMTPANVDQIFARFKRDNRTALLADEEHSGS